MKGREDLTMGCLYALLGFDLLAWACLAGLGSDTLTSQGGIHAGYYFYLPIKVAATVLVAGALQPLTTRYPQYPRLRPIAGLLGVLVGTVALGGLAIYLFFYTGGI